MAKRPHLVIALLACLVASQAFGSWAWPLPAERYAQMNALERALYDKARNTLESGQYKVAGSAFEKFQIQLEFSDFVPYVLFMRGYCLHMAKSRGEAIKIYNEVMDFFPDRIEDASAALYHLGLAHFENGDDHEGMKLMKEMVEDEDYSNHPLAARALVRLADNHMLNKEPDQAVKYWRQVLRDFGESNAAAANDARRRITAFCLQNRRMSSYDKWMGSDQLLQDPGHRRWCADFSYGIAQPGFRHGQPADLWPQFRSTPKPEWIADMQTYWEYFQAHRKWYEQEQEFWSYHVKALNILALFDNHKDTAGAVTDAAAFVKTEKDQAKRFRMYLELVLLIPEGQAKNEAIEQAIALAAANTDDEKADEQYGQLINVLLGAGQFSSARMVTDRMKDRLLAAWKTYEILGREGKWVDAVATLEEIEKVGDAANQLRAKETRAGIYKNTREWEKAIKLYSELSNPPGTLWAIQYCYHGWGKLDQAIAVLSEIQAGFPDQAPQALWTQAQYFHGAGRAKNAVACARQILKAYPKHAVSSSAHQLLEGYGIKTGGGVIE